MRLNFLHIPVLIKVTDSLRIDEYRSIHVLELNGLEEPSPSPELTRSQDRRIPLRLDRSTPRVLIQGGTQTNEGQV